MVRTGIDMEPSEERRLLQEILAQVRAGTGRDFSRYERSAILRRIERRMQLCRVEALPAYLALLQEQPDELHALSDEFLLTGTHFFRDPEAFEQLEKVIPSIFDAKHPGDRVRVWSIGCATGEEAYAIAMLLLEEAARRKAPPRIHVFATDLHESSLRKAREGVYPDDIEADVSPERLQRFFTHESGSYRIRREVRDLVLFAPHDLLVDPPFSKVDLIVCRYVTSYPERAAQRHAVDLFHDALNPNGLLLLGASESVDRSDRFDVVSEKASLYRKRNVRVPEPRETLRSADEELRSEELAVLKKELQSMNEELRVLYQENRHRAEELGQIVSDLQNLLTSSDIATLFLDRSLRILRFTPRVGELFNIRLSDRGRPLSDLNHRLGYTGLLDDVRQVLERLVPLEREIEDDEHRWYLTRLMPYRMADGHIDGVVVTFIDITTRRAAETALRRLNETLEERVAERTAQVRELVRRLTMAEQEERRRVSQILHDDLQQILFGIRMRTSAVATMLGPAGRASVLKELEAVDAWVVQAIDLTRRLTVELSPPILKNEGLTDALRWLQRQMEEQHGLRVEVEAEQAFRLKDEDLRVLLFQIVRELLFNVKKHAGVDRATVRLTRPDDLIIEVVDEGRGYDAAASRDAVGFGLYGVRERLRLLGGRVEIRSKPGQGTHVTVHVPATV